MRSSSRIIIFSTLCFFIATAILPLNYAASESLAAEMEAGETELSFEEEIKLLEELLEDLKTVRNQIAELRDSFDVLQNELGELEERINSVKKQIENLR